MSKLYTVRAGDSLSRIAARMKTTVAALAQKNGISKERLNNLSVGQRLRLDSFEPAKTTKRVSSGGETPVSTKKVPGGSVTTNKRVSSGGETAVSKTKVPGGSVTTNKRVSSGGESPRVR
jgi:LysM repeat protein